MAGGGRRRLESSEIRWHELGPRQGETRHHGDPGLFRQLKLPAFLDAFEDGADAIRGKGRDHGGEQRVAGAGFISRAIQSASNFTMSGHRSRMRLMSDSSAP